MARRKEVPRRGGQVLGSSLEAHVLRSDNSALAKDCRKEMKAVTARLGKLGRKVPPRSAARCSPHCGCRPHAGRLVWISVDPGKSVDTARGAALDSGLHGEESSAHGAPGAAKGGAQAPGAGCHRGYPQCPGEIAFAHH